MRKTLVAVVLVLGLIPGGTAASSAAPARLERYAAALWSVGQKKDGTEKLVVALVWAEEQGEESSASFGLFRGYCPAPSDGDDCLVSIDGAVVGKAKPGEAEVDAALGSAHLKVTRRGRTHEITWTADNVPPEPDAGSIGCGEDVAWASAWGERAASASGSALREKLRADAPIHLADLTLQAAICDPTGGLLSVAARYLRAET